MNKRLIAKELVKIAKTLMAGGNLKIIAQNEAYWQWEYDTRRIIAKLLIDDEADLFFKLTDTREKSGIGAGKIEKEIFNKKIGNVLFESGRYNLDLSKIRTLMIKNNIDRSSAGHGWTKKWLSPDGKEDSLTGLLKSYIDKNKLSIGPIKELTPDDKTKELQSLVKNLSGEDINAVLEFIKSRDKKFAKNLIAIEFNTKAEYDKYMKEHPDADKSNHSIKPEKKHKFTEGVERVMNNQCPECGKKVSIDDFDPKDIWGIKTYRVTGLCQECMDK